MNQQIKDLITKQIETQALIKELSLDVQKRQDAIDEQIRIKLPYLISLLGTDNFNNITDIQNAFSIVTKRFVPKPVQITDELIMTPAGIGTKRGWTYALKLDKYRTLGSNAGIETQTKLCKNIINNISLIERHIPSRHMERFNSMKKCLSLLDKNLQLMNKHYQVTLPSPIQIEHYAKHYYRDDYTFEVRNVDTIKLHQYEGYYRITLTKNAEDFTIRVQPNENLSALISLQENEYGLKALQEIQEEFKKDKLEIEKNCNAIKLELAPYLVLASLKKKDSEA